MSESVTPREAWEQGTPLDRAWWEFAPADDQQELRAIYDWEQGGFGGRLPETFSDDARLLERAVSAVGHVAQSFALAKSMESRKGELEASLKEVLLERILTGEFVATGCNSKNRHYQRVPSALFCGADIDWRFSNLENGSHRFHAIRLLLDEEFDQLRPSKGLPGRPSNERVIMLAIRIADSQVEDFQSINKKSAPSQVRSIIGKKWPLSIQSNRGYSDKTINRYIREFYKLKNSN